MYVCYKVQKCIHDTFFATLLNCIFPSETTPICLGAASHEHDICMLAYMLTKLKDKCIMSRNDIVIPTNIDMFYM